MRIVEVRVVAAFGVELEDDEPYDAAGIETDFRAWMGQFGPVREFTYSDDVPAPAEGEAPQKPQAPQRPPFRRPPPKIFQQVAAEAPSVPVEESAPEPAAFTQEEPSNAGGRTRKRPAARQRSTSRVQPK